MALLRLRTGRQRHRLPHGARGDELPRGRPHAGPAVWHRGGGTEAHPRTGAAAHEARKHVHHQRAVRRTLPPEPAEARAQGRTRLHRRPLGSRVRRGDGHRLRPGHVGRPVALRASRRPVAGADDGDGPVEAQRAGPLLRRLPGPRGDTHPQPHPANHRLHRPRHDGEGHGQVHQPAGERHLPQAQLHLRHRPRRPPGRQGGQVLPSGRRSGRHAAATHPHQQRRGAAGRGMDARATGTAEEVCQAGLHPARRRRAQPGARREAGGRHAQRPEERRAGHAVRAGRQRQGDPPGRRRDEAGSGQLLHQPSEVRRAGRRGLHRLDGPLRIPGGPDHRRAGRGGEPRLRPAGPGTGRHEGRHVHQGAVRQGLCRQGRLGIGPAPRQEAGRGRPRQAGPAQPGRGHAGHLRLHGDERRLLRPGREVVDAVEQLHHDAHVPHQGFIAAQTPVPHRQ